MSSGTPWKVYQKVGKKWKMRGQFAQLMDTVHAISALEWPNCSIRFGSQQVFTDGEDGIFVKNQSRTVALLIHRRMEAEAAEYERIDTRTDMSIYSKEARALIKAAGRDICFEDLRRRVQELRQDPVIRKVEFSA